MVKERKTLEKTDPLTDMRLFGVEIYIIPYENNNRWYEGEFVNGKRHGQGRCFYRKSPCIEWTGEWVDDNWLIGVVTWLADGTFIGRWNHINSTFVRDNGDDYCGELSFDGIAHGYGVMNYINGSCYRGMWREGWRWGLGILTYPDGCKYESEWTAGSLYVNNVDISFLHDKIRSFTDRIDSTNVFSIRNNRQNGLKSYIHAQVRHETSPTRLCTIMETILTCLSSIHANQFINDFISHSQFQRNFLLIAVMHGFYNIIELLLTKFNINIEIEGVLQLENEIIYGITPLWCAVGFDHLNIVQLLIRHGANVNHCILSKSTPMRVACYNGRIDIVKYLVDNGGDIKLVNAYDSTCLMIAAYRGHTELCRYLLGIGAEINAKDKEGSTPLHYACETNNLDLVKLLINSGAVNSKNLNGVTPLHIAASEPRPSIVEYFVNKSDYCSKIEQVEALELQAASYCNHTTATYDISKVYEYLFQAMQLRHADPEQPILKAYQQPLPIFNNQLECQTLEELEKIRFSNDTLRIETLLVLQRILGTTNSTALDSIMYRGVIFAREKRYEHSLLFSLYVMEIRKSIGESLQLLLSSVVNVFSDMMMHKVDIPCDTLIRAMKYAIGELMENELSSFNSSFESTLHLIVIISKVGATAVLLTETGVDVNATDMQRNTPLHVISSSRHADITDITVIINSLVAYGAHIDTLNNLGMTPIECIDTTRSDIRTLLKSQTKLSLKCISARIIVEYKIEYDSHVSKALAEFIQHHS
ncbi:unnamed protein product [Didymodactylos carnosus]|uniref:Ankyrin repeat-containing protein n=1 Tax=Didymodactylos carnosus TaxID=1234261 RepID=A0A8S2HP74_9BILA|nr:unnamed protein product [Didymodactylos carnosus]CAF3671519.1 unnamed protein product [Didymodactylos carnosus]